VADALLCYTTAAVLLVAGGQMSVSELAAAQESCVETKAMRGCPDVQQVLVGGKELTCMGQTGALRPVVPVSLRRKVFDSIHGLAHAGVRATKRLMTSRYVWPAYASQVAEWYRECVGCAQGKPGVKEKAPVVPSDIPSRKFSHVHVDLVGPLPPAADG